jgi:Fic family protein
MHGLINSNGQIRTKGVGVFKDNKLAHMAPPASRVPSLMKNLFEFLKYSKDISWLLKACIFHCELEFIHPFADGNGRMGRLWQQLLLIKENPIFEFISTESIIKHNQQEYYDVLAECDKQGESTGFIEFSLRNILLTLKEYTSNASTQTMQKIFYNLGPQEKNICPSTKTFHPQFSRWEGFAFERNNTKAPR